MEDLFLCLIFLETLTIIVGGFILYKRYCNDKTYHINKLDKLESLLVTNIETGNQRYKAIVKENNGIRSEIAAKTNELKKHLDGASTLLYRVMDEHKSEMSEQEKKINTLITNTSQGLKNELKRLSTVIKGNLESLDRNLSPVNELLSGIQTAIDINGAICGNIKEELARVLRKNHENTQKLVEIIGLLNNISEYVLLHSEEVTDHIKKMRPINDTILELQSLCQEISQTDRDVHEQAVSISSMINQHLKIAQLTDELNRTAKDVFGLMKLVLMSSIIDHSKLIENKIKNDNERQTNVVVDDLTVIEETQIKEPQNKNTYIIKFDVKIKDIKAGQSLGLLGCIPELGNWDENKILKFKRKNSQNFSLEVTISTAASIVEFKYVIINSNGELLMWEKGANRQINLGLLHDFSYSRRDSLNINFFLTKQEDFKQKNAGIEDGFRQESESADKEIISTKGSKSLFGRIAEMATHIHNTASAYFSLGNIEDSNEKTPERFVFEFIVNALPKNCKVGLKLLGFNDEGRIKILFNRDSNNLWYCSMDRSVLKTERYKHYFKFQVVIIEDQGKLRYSKSERGHIDEGYFSKKYHISSFK